MFVFGLFLVCLLLFVVFVMQLRKYSARFLPDLLFVLPGNNHLN